jgi:hypothetical protein
LARPFGKQRATLRGPALDGLRADGAAWTRVLEKAPAQDRLRVPQVVREAAELFAWSCRQAGVG